jgi:predicted membrane protein
MEVIIVLILIAIGIIYALWRARMTTTLIALIIFVLITIFVSSIFGVVIGIIFFFAFLIPGFKYSVANDIAWGVFDEHHRRNDARARKIMESQRFIAKEQDMRRMRIEKVLEEHRREKATISDYYRDYEEDDDDRY